MKTTNLWLEILAETGIVGFTAFTVWAVRPLRHLRRLRQFNVSAGLVAAVVASLAMFPFIQTWWRPYLWVPWILVAAWTPRSLGPPVTVRPGSGTGADDRTGESTDPSAES